MNDQQKGRNMATHIDVKLIDAILRVDVDHPTYKARNWTPKQFLAWYSKETHASRNMTADHLFGMEDEQVEALTRLANDLIDDLARNRKRKLALKQSLDGLSMKDW